MQVRHELENRTIRETILNFFEGINEGGWESVIFVKDGNMTSDTVLFDVSAFVASSHLTAEESFENQLS
jgi:hypothetical protein